MELNVENNKDESNYSLYSILRTEKDGIKIVEINERGCNYHDFVLIYYKAATENIPLLKQFHEKYFSPESILIEVNGHKIWKMQLVCCKLHGTVI